MASTDIVGYTYQAENYCLRCVLAVVDYSADEPAPGPDFAERALDVAANLMDINRHDERSYDSNDFPKVIFDSQVEDADERCGGCHESLIG
ncbi:hypothetical protein [Mycolicibacterium sp.]|uniref:hypothetical protein n=1 Tax=Mycolicibacterium sp. TaxID=2320850 RepID=UPI00355DDD2B